MNKPQDWQHTKDVALRFTISQKQYDALKQAAEARGVRVNEMARTLLLSVLMPYKPPVVTDETTDRR